MKDFYIVGSGMNYGLALEAQIKMMETMCIPTCAVDSEEFSHGTHRSINRDTTMLVIRTGRNATFAQSIYDYFNKLANVIMIETFPENRQKNVISITDCKIKAFTAGVKPFESGFALLNYIKAVVNW